MTTRHDQAGHAIRCEWGERGLAALRDADVTVIVDVLSFSTAVSVAVSRGASVLPYRHRDATAAAFARSQGARLAGPRGSSLSLSPGSLAQLEAGARVVLPSPNGATLSLAAADRGRVLCGCLRNAVAVAAAIPPGARVAVIPAGERWPDGALRPALEDWLGAGAIIDQLTGDLSPEARAARDAYRAARSDLVPTLLGCGSGRELEARGYADDVLRAAEVNADRACPELRAGAYVAVD